MKSPQTAERAYASRAREFDQIFGCLTHPQSLMDAIAANPTSVDLELEGIRFECGNVGRLLPDIQVDTAAWPHSWKPTYISHLDSVSATRKKEIEVQFNLRSGSITSPQRKADLLFIDEKGKPHYISFKDTDKPCKLGQVSRSEKYLKANLGGGHLVDLPEGLIPNDIVWSDTYFSEEKFNKLGTRDKQYAYLKQNRPDDWRRIVEVSLEVAYSQLACFGLSLEFDRSSFIEFLGKTLAGNLRDSSDFYLALGSETIHFTELMMRLRSSEFTLSTKMVETKSKKALIIEVNSNSGSYGLTRIEPSFEGDGLHVGQTKGIIYHFQQFPNAGNHYIKLFLDVMQ